MSQAGRLPNCSNLGQHRSRRGGTQRQTNAKQLHYAAQTAFHDNNRSASLCSHLILANMESDLVEIGTWLVVSTPKLVDMGQSRVNLGRRWHNFDRNRANFDRFRANVDRSRKSLAEFDRFRAAGAKFIEIGRSQRGIARTRPRFGRCRANLVDVGRQSKLEDRWPDSSRTRRKLCDVDRRLPDSDKDLRGLQEVAWPPFRNATWAMYSAGGGAAQCAPTPALPPKTRPCALSKAANLMDNSSMEVTLSMSRRLTEAMVRAPR